MHDIKLVDFLEQWDKDSTSIDVEAVWPSINAISWPSNSTKLLKMKKAVPTLKEFMRTRSRFGYSRLSDPFNTVYVQFAHNNYWKEVCTVSLKNKDLLPILILDLKSSSPKSRLRVLEYNGLEMTNSAILSEGGLDEVKKYIKNNRDQLIDRLLASVELNVEIEEEFSEFNFLKRL